VLRLIKRHLNACSKNSETDFDCKWKVKGKIKSEAKKRLYKPRSRHEVSAYLSKAPGVSYAEYDDFLIDLKTIASYTGNEVADWMNDATLRFCRTRMRNAVLYEIVDYDEPDRKSKATIAELAAQLVKADSFTLEDDSVCMDGWNWRSLAAEIRNPETLFPFRLSILNEMTGGGTTRQTLNVLLAPTNKGKSLVMVDFAAAYLQEGRNVLYITLEMSAEKTKRRVYANLLDTEYDVFGKLPDHPPWTDQQWSDAFAKLGPHGQFKIRQYAPGSAHAGHFRQLLETLKTKQNFVPDAIFVDYLNKCQAHSMKYGKSVGMYQVIGAVAEELRAIAVDYNIVVWSATQTNRDGYHEVPDLEHTSESAKTNMEGDLIIGFNDAPDDRDALVFAVRKNRDAGRVDKPFVVGVNRAKMTLIDRPVIQQPKAQAVPPHVAALQKPTRRKSRIPKSLHGRV
jgi:DnaB-like helicase C terminal domain